METWKDIKGYEGLYQISNYGRVKSLILHNGVKNHILKPRINKYGYLQVSLYKHGKPTTFTVHRLVGLTFLPNPNHYTQINHLDGERLNNNVSNLSWCNSQINNRHRVYTLNNTGAFPKPQKIMCVETRQIYQSIHQAEVMNNINAIYKILDKSNRTAGGYHWIHIK